MQYKVPGIYPMKDDDFVFHVSKEFMEIFTSQRNKKKEAKLDI